MAPVAQRPKYLTLLSALIAIQGIAVGLLGVFLVLDRNDADLLRHINETDALDQHQLTPDMLLSIGVAGIVLGAVLVVLSIALASGNRLARWFVAIGCVLNAGVALHSLVALHGEQQLTGAMTLSLAVFTLWFMFGNDQAKQFFED